MEENKIYAKENIAIDDFKSEINKKILSEIYTEIENKNYNINIILNHMQDDNLQDHITSIMTEDYGITDNKKAITEIIHKYKREKLEKRRDEILRQEEQEIDIEKKKQLGIELNNIILELVKLK